MIIYVQIVSIRQTDLMRAFKSHDFLQVLFLSLLFVEILGSMHIEVTNLDLLKRSISSSSWVLVFFMSSRPSTCKNFASFEHVYRLFWRRFEMRCLLDDVRYEVKARVPVRFRLFAYYIFPKLRALSFNFLIESFYFISILLPKFFNFLNLSWRVYFDFFFMNSAWRLILEKSKIFCWSYFKPFTIFEFLNKREVWNEIFLAVFLEHIFKLLKNFKFAIKFLSFFKVCWKERRTQSCFMLFCTWWEKDRLI